LGSEKPIIERQTERHKPKPGETAGIVVRCDKSPSANKMCAVVCIQREDGGGEYGNHKKKEENMRGNKEHKFGALEERKAKGRCF